MPRRTKEEAERTRAALLDAAAEVFLERGVARASLEEVASRAGVTRGAVYWHFRDKLDLFLALDERARLPHEDLAERLAAYPRLDPLDELYRSTAEAFAGLEAAPERRRLLTVLVLRCEYVAEMAPALDRQRRAHEALREELNRVFAMAAERGRLDPAWRPEVAALTYLSLVLGLLQEWLRDTPGFGLATDATEAVNTLLATMARGNRPDGTAPPAATPRGDPT